MYLVREDLVAQLSGAGGSPAQREPEVGEGIVLLGVLNREAGGDGRLSFVVPEIPPARYTTGVWCVPCGETFSVGTQPGLEPSGEASVVLNVQAAAAGSGSDDYGAAAAVVSAAVVVSVLIVIGAIVFQRRRRDAAVEP